MSIDTATGGFGRLPFEIYRRAKIRPFLALALVLSLLLVLPGCSGSDDVSGGKGGGDAKSKTPPVPVSVAVSARKDMPVALEAIGTVEPFATVGIRSQVAGILEKVAFREGDRVKRGELLFSIDRRPFSARFNQAQADLARDSAALGNARKQAERYRPAAEKGYVSEEQADQAQTSVATLTAAVQADEAALENARLDLENCTIRSPITGFTGQLLADRGNLVKAAADQPLVTINQIDPVKVSFSLPEQSVSELKMYLAQGGVEVTATPQDSALPPLTGEFSFMDNAVDQASGTILLKATFANPDQILWPGQFVKVRLRLTTRKNVTVIPTPAVQTGQSGAYVYVISGEMIVEQRPVTVGFTYGDETVIDSGLAAGEEVVTDGQLRLRPGVTIKALQPGGKGDIPDEAEGADKSDSRNSAGTHQ